MQLTVRQPSASEDAKHYTTERLRGEYLIETVFAPDDAILTYSHFDRIIAGGVMPVSKSVELVGCKELASDTFLQRREMGVINIGGKGKIAVDGVEYDLKQYDGLYVGMGAKTLSFTSDDPADPANKAETEALLAQIRAYAVTDAVKNVTCEKPEVFNPQGETHIVLMHYGCKRNIVRCLVKRGCKVTVMPAFATAEEIKALAPDGIMLSNGPGDPAEPVEVIENLKHIFELNIPTFGICLGHQLSALAAGAKTMKLKYGHRGANQPVTDFESGRTFITSQNHGYAVVGDELPAEMGEVAQVNANDGTCEGIKYKKWNCFTVQFHPEANGGPKDTEFLFDRFLNNVKAAKKEAR